EDDGLRGKIEDLLAEQTTARETDALGAIEKHGVATGQFAVNPFNGERVPIWVGNYILADYGTGAIMSVPAHDERDFEFAQKYGLPVRRGIAPPDWTKHAEEHSAQVEAEDVVGELPYLAEDEALLIGSGEWSGLGCVVAQEKMAAFAKAN